MMPPLSRVNRLDRSALKRGWHACSRRKATRRGRIGCVRLVLVGESLTSRLRPALCAAFVGCAAIAASVQANAEQPATLLEEVVVVAPSLEESVPLELRQFGNRVEIITAEELALGGFNDIGQTLQMRVPGLYLAPKNGAFDYVNCALQGSRCQDILWLIDGVRINNRLYNSTSPLDTVPAHMVERVEVLYGGQGIFYGTQSVAGVVNVVTKVFSNETDASVRLGADGNDGVHASVDYRVSRGGHGLVLYASTDEADGFQPFVDGHYQPSGTDRARGYEVRTAGFKYGRSFRAGSRFVLHAHRTDNEVDWASPANRALSFNARKENLVTAKWDQAVGDDVELFVKGYLHQWDSRWTRIDNDLDDTGNLTGSRVVLSDREYWGYDDYGLTAMARIATGGGFDYALGYDHQRFSGRDDVLLIADRTESVNALFGQIRSSEALLPHTRLALGARYNRPSGEGDIALGNLSARHAFTDSVYLRGSAGTSVRLPDAWQLYGNDPCCTRGNPDLEGEKSGNANVALGGSAAVGNALTWESVLFRRTVEHLIGSRDGMRINSDHAVDFGGWELSLGLSLTPSLLATVDHTATTAEEKGSGEQVAGIPKRTLKASLAYQPAGGALELQFSLVNVGEVFDTVYGNIGRVEHGGYTVVDLRGVWHFGSDGRHALGARAENAFDEAYATSLGRAFADVGGASYRYDNLGTPRTFHAWYEHRF